ncbi:hypothetical protein BOX15_Mlig019300g1 [Macrostomum lignano]|uniref:WAP domain-containing protein n=1 Tax=Macrostomum lignano TaxID=282301 RepID=A0A267DUZ3_9PLAT|nr:hypothetical protein BOX15_Mlig019300g1 [Macrostomum lignano]
MEMCRIMAYLFVIGSLVSSADQQKQQQEKSKQPSRLTFSCIYTQVCRPTMEDCETACPDGWSQPCHLEPASKKYCCTGCFW